MRSSSSGDGRVAADAQPDEHQPDPRQAVASRRTPLLEAGRFNAEPSVVRAMCFPLMLETVKDKTVAGDAATTSGRAPAAWMVTDATERQDEHRGLGSLRARAGGAPGVPGLTAAPGESVPDGRALSVPRA